MLLCLTFPVLFLFVLRLRFPRGANGHVCGNKAKVALPKPGRLRSSSRDEEEEEVEAQEEMKEEYAFLHGQFLHQKNLNFSREPKFFQRTYADILLNRHQEQIPSKTKRPRNSPCTYINDFCNRSWFATVRIARLVFIFWGGIGSFCPCRQNHRVPRLPGSDALLSAPKILQGFQWFFFSRIFLYLCTLCCEVCCHFDAIF